MASDQQQFLDVIDRDEAERRFRDVLRLEPLGEEQVALDTALGRVLSRHVAAAVDVPSFDRSNVDGFALHADDTYGATEERPRRVRLLGPSIATGVPPQVTVSAGNACPIATGGMIPRGADAVMMVEHADVETDNGATAGSDTASTLLVRKALTAGANIAFAGSDIAAGEIVLRAGQLLTSRETGVLAAIGADRAWVWRRPMVAIISTGDELIAPGQPMRPAMVYDSNARILSDAVCELGGEPLAPTVVRDDLAALAAALHTALATADVVLLSGGTSKGEGDFCYRVVAELRDPGIVAHGVALKPGKPICLAATAGKPVVVLPGFPTSAIFTFHEFVAPVIRRLAGRCDEQAGQIDARLAIRVNSEIGRTEYLLVSLSPGGDGSSDNLPAAFPMGKGSGSVTTFSRADGFITIDRHQEIVAADTVVSVRLLGRDTPLADLTVIGSHCVGLDVLLAHLDRRDWRSKSLAVGSTAGLEAVRRRQCDLAGIHLLDPNTGEYNRPFLPPDVTLIAGYHRMQGVVFRPGDPRFVGRSLDDAVRSALADAECLMVNRNQGSGTRVLIDRLLAEHFDRFADGQRPAGYANQPRSHNAVAAAVAQRRADWGVTIETVATAAGLGFLPLADECFDFAVRRDRIERPAVRAFCDVLADPAIRGELRAMGFALS
ncbi:MAG: molybdopterin biosynthesis protein [Pirellulales bacterium]